MIPAGLVQLAENVVNIFSFATATTGIILIAYSFAAIRGQNYKLVDDYGEHFARILSVIAIIILYASLFSRPAQDPVWWSLRFTGPAMVIIALLVLFYRYEGQHLPNHATNGLALVALAGSILRSFPHV